MKFKYKLTEKIGVFTKENGSVAYIALIDCNNNPIGTFARMKGIKA